MWSAIAGSVVLLGALLARGWGADAWRTAALVSVLACVSICVWAGVASDRAAVRAHRQLVERLQLQRER